MNKVLLIGGPANISSHSALDLLDRGFEVSIFSRSVSRDDFNVASRCEMIIGNRDDTQALRRAIQLIQPDCIIDFCCFYPYQMKGLLSQVPLSLKQLVFISTVDVYGYPLSRLPMREDDPKRAPNCAYAKDKRACEKMLRQSEISAISTVVRPAYSMGPRFALTALSRSGGLSLVPRLRTGLPVISPDDGQRLLHAGSARDSGRMIARLVLESVSIGRDYNVGAVAALPYDDYLTLFADALGTKANLVHIPTEQIYQLADAAIFEENLLYDLTSHDVSFSVNRFLKDFPDFEWIWSLESAISEYIAYQDAHSAFAFDALDLEDNIISRWQQATL
ncbi:MAG: NAD-dependent epimerase/dehydratase family protein [Christensenellales bacterium]